MLELPLLELQEQKLVFQQVLLLQEQIEEQLALHLDFEFQHWKLEHRSLEFLEQLVVLAFLLLVLQLLELLECPLLEQLEQLCYLRLLV